MIRCQTNPGPQHLAVLVLYEFGVPTSLNLFPQCDFHLYLILQLFYQIVLVISIPYALQHDLVADTLEKWEDITIEILNIPHSIG